MYDNLKYAGDIIQMTESKEELKSFLIKVKEESEKDGLKLNIQKTKIMACGPITLWQIDGGKNGNSDRFYFLGLQNNCRWWLQPWNEKTLAPWKKSILKSRDITLPTNVLIVKPMVFPVVMYRCENWTIKKAAAKSLQSCLTLCDPIDGSPPGSPVPGILQARTLEWVAISFSSAWKWKVKVKSLSHVQPSETPWTAAYQATPSIGFSRQEYWSGVPLPSLVYMYMCKYIGEWCERKPKYYLPT